MGFGYNIDPRKLILDNVLEGVEAYLKENALATQFGKPVIGYAEANNPLFDIFFDRGENLHPKAVYRPGTTVIVHFLPFHREVLESNRGAHRVSQEWTRAMNESIMLSTRINSIIKETMAVAGHTVSGTALPGDWDTEKFAPEWNHKIAAFICGLGELSIGGSFQTAAGVAGRFGSVITDYPIELYNVWRPEEIDEIRKDKEFYHRNSFLWSPQVSESKRQELQQVCPAGAVSEAGIDREKCQDYCMGLDHPAPSPDACGKCWV